MEIIHFQNPVNKTPFAPMWEYDICVDDISKHINLDKLKDLVLDNELKLIQKYEYTHDWNTGLGRNSLTSRSNNYNLLKWNGTQDLKSAIKNTLYKFTHGLGIDIEGDFYIQCWANVLRNNEEIKTHHHWHSPYTFLGGHICIQQDSTSTFYKNPYTGHEYEIINQVGKITLFPNWLPHRTNKHLKDKERITLAFDIIPEITYNEDIYDEKKGHWVLL